MYDLLWLYTEMHSVTIFLSHWRVCTEIIRYLIHSCAFKWLIAVHIYFHWAAIQHHTVCNSDYRHSIFTIMLIFFQFCVRLTHSFFKFFTTIFFCWWCMQYMFTFLFLFTCTEELIDNEKKSRCNFHITMWVMHFFN